MATTIRFVEGAETLARTPDGWVAPEQWLSGNGAPKLRRRTVDIVYPTEKLLKREIKLPKLGGRKAIQAAVDLDMRRNTPFNGDDTFSVLADVRKAGNGIVAEHWIAKRQDLAEARHRLASIGLSVRRVVAPTAGNPVLADFTSEVYPLGKFLGWINSLSLVALLGSATWFWAAPVLEARSTTERQLEVNARLTERAVSLRNELEGLHSFTEERISLVQHFGSRMPISGALRELTSSFPDDVWISEIQFRTDEVVVTGSINGSAARMLLDLSANTVLMRPTLDGPVTRTGTGEESFKLVFETDQAVGQ